ncbi:hypothetical protein [Sinobacterium caligoides]|nr:hypothetical protein [Sinobacterium caligoides]
MLSFIRQALGMGSTAPAPLTAPRYVDLGGNQFQFALPEDFSRDMPAEPLVTQLNVDDASRFTPPNHGLLLQRWWDIKQPGWFGKNLGTIMLSINVLPKPQNTEQLLDDSPYGLHDRLGFMLMLNQVLYERYPDSRIFKDGEPPLYSPSAFVFMLGAKLQSGFRNQTANQQQWTRYDVSGPEALIIANYAIPLTPGCFLEASFHYSPNRHIPPRLFGDIAFEKMRPVIESFAIQYKADNPMQAVVGGQWLEQTPDQVLQQHETVIGPRLFGEQSYRGMLEHRALLLE